MKRFSFIFVALIILIGSAANGGDTLRVERVVDGDTFVLINGDRVRLIGVDTPETVHPSKPVEYFGKEASKFLTNMITDKEVILDYDWERYDKYDRILAYVYLLDGTFVNAEIIKQGYGHAYTKYPFKQEYMDQFRQLETVARETGAGLWGDDSTKAQLTDGKYWLNTKTNTLHNSTCKWYNNTTQGRFVDEVTGKNCGICGGTESQDSIKENRQSNSDGDIIVYVTKSGTKYHLSGCRHLKKSKISMKLSEAKKKYGPCSTCNPPR